MDRAVARAGVLTWTETGAGPHGQTGLITAAPQMWGDVVLARKERRPAITSPSWSTTLCKA